MENIQGGDSGGQMEDREQRKKKKSYIYDKVVGSKSSRKQGGLGFPRLKYSQK
jgi:hypothetical protein